RYRQYCGELVAQTAGKALNDTEANNLARICAVGPADAKDAGQLVQWAVDGVKAQNVGWRLHVLALTQYRAEQYDHAIDSTQKSVALEWKGLRGAPNWPVLSMAHYRLGHIDEARHCLETARELTAEAAPKQLTSPAMSPVSWMEMQLLIPEAAALLETAESGP